MTTDSYDMEVGENRVRVFYSKEKREGERLEIYTGGISPAAAPCIRPVTCLRHKYTCNTDGGGRSSDGAMMRIIKLD